MSTALFTELLFPLRQHMTALESPTLAENIFCPSMRMETHVDPLNLISMLELIIYLLICSNAKSSEAGIELDVLSCASR
jgi:hypothetical protein